MANSIIPNTCRNVCIKGYVSNGLKDTSLIWEIFSLQFTIYIYSHAYMYSLMYSYVCICITISINATKRRIFRTGFP